MLGAVESSPLYYALLATLLEGTSAEGKIYELLTERANTQPEAAMVLLVLQPNSAKRANWLKVVCTDNRWSYELGYLLAQLWPDCFAYRE